MSHNLPGVVGTARDLPSARRPIVTLRHTASSASPVAARRPRLAPAVPLTIAALVATLLTQLVAPGRAEARSLVPAVPVRSTLEAAIGTVVLTELNLERTLHGLAPVRMNSHLQLSARRHNVLMARTNTMSHQLRNEPVFTSRMSQAGYKWQWAGENIAWNSDISTAGVLYLQRLMYNEKPPENGHRLNILNGHFRDVGVDVLVDTKHHKVWLTTDFGRS